MDIFIVTLAVFCILFTERCDHARSEDVCVAERFFFKKAQDAVLINHVIAKHQVTSVIHCAHRCMREARCVSFNYQDHPTSLGHVCQINDKKKQKNFENFIGLDGFSYFEFEQPLVCGVGSCQNGGRCVEQCDGKRKCICLEGYTGAHCENILTTETLPLPVTAVSSCKELYDKHIRPRRSQVFPLMFDEQTIPVYCHMENFGCGDGGWTPAMKINGSKRTFHYDSHFWSDRKGYNLTAGQTGFDSQETKLPTYWNTSFSKICLGMKIDQQINFIVINKTATSLYSLIADGQYRPTSLGRNTWKKLIGSQASLQRNCNKEGFNAVGNSYSQSKARIGITNNQENDCRSCDSRIGFGTGGHDDDSNTCGNEAARSPDNGIQHIKAMGYILVQ